MPSASSIPFSPSYDPNSYIDENGNLVPFTDVSPDVSGGGDGSGIDPLMLASIGSGALAGYNKSKLTQQELAQQKALAEEQMANQRALEAAGNAASAARQESTVDPFRQQMAQGSDIAKLDQEANAKFSPVKLDFSGSPYAKYVPQQSGGFSYTKSQDVIDAANALKRNVEGGNVDQTMTNPKNYGKTGALDLVGLQKAGVDPAGVSAAGGEAGANAATTAADEPTASYMDGYQLRGGGTSGPAAPSTASTAARGATGALGGAATGVEIGSAVPGIGTAVGAGVGALVGAGPAIAGLFDKHAASAATDYSVQDATTVLDKAIRGYLGRPPNPGEIDQMLRGQGLKPGDRYVGSAGLQGILTALQRQAQDQPIAPSYTGHG